MFHFSPLCPEVIFVLVVLGCLDRVTFLTESRLNLLSSVTENIVGSTIRYKRSAQLSRPVPLWRAGTVRVSPSLWCRSATTRGCSSPRGKIRISQATCFPVRSSRLESAIPWSGTSTLCPTEDCKALLARPSTTCSGTVCGSRNS